MRCYETQVSGVPVIIINMNEEPVECGMCSCVDFHRHAGRKWRRRLSRSPRYSVKRRQKQDWIDYDPHRNQPRLLPRRRVRNGW